MRKKIGTVASDVTERKRREEALRESEERFRDVPGNSRDMIYRLNLKTGQYDYLSQALEELLGYSPQEATAVEFERASPVIHPDDRERLTEDLGKLFAHTAEEDTVHSIEYRVKHKELGYRWVSDSRSVVYDDGNVPVAVVGTLRDITERKQAEEALRQSQQDYLLLLESTSEGIGVIDAKTLKVLFGNRRAARILGFDPMTDDPRLVNILDLVHPDDKAIVIKGFAQDLHQQERRQRYEVRAKTKDGREIWVSVLGTRIEFQGRQAALLSLIDVTERKQAEEELAEYHQHLEELVEERTSELKHINEQLQQEIVERKRAEAELRIKDWAIASSINAIVMADLEGNLIYVNASFLNIWGYDSSEEIIGRPAVEFWQDRRKAASVVRALLRKGIWQGELVALRADGSAFDVHVLASMVEDDEGEPVCLMASFIDITERKRMEEALRAKEEYFRSLIENSLDVIAVVNPDGTVRYQSPSYQRVLGHRPEERPDMNALEFVHPDDIPKAMEAFSQLLENPDITLNAEVRVRHGDGSYRTLEVIGRNLLHDPVVGGIVANFRDISERKKAEEKLRRLYQREKELRRELEAEMKRRAEFTRALAHELKTPLTPVVMSSQLLASELKDETLLRVARNISRGASNLNSRIDELLDLARGEMGMLHLKAEKVDARELLQEVIEDVASVPSSHGQSLVSKLPPSLPSVWCDRVRLRQIMLNLLNNAFKFTPEGGEITLRAEQEDANLVVEVQDTGPGIAEEEQQRLFEPYHRVDADREQLSGLGLGLALCKRLVGLHKGRIWARSHVGKGSTFGFSLPLEGPESIASPDGQAPIDES